ncbi:hypothetical protein, partial [Streptomyces sp. NPDC102409]|uniref:hypothetical protein n=1 Tax=Streptomyces sp. NPDC102409 TaxID=3366172 RepID=UPI00380C3D91
MSCPPGHNGHPGNGRCREQRKPGQSAQGGDRSMSEPSSLSNLLKEERRFAPPADLAANANVTAEAYERAEADRLG